MYASKSQVTAQPIYALLLYYYKNGLGWPLWYTPLSFFPSLHCSFYPASGCEGTRPFKQVQKKHSYIFTLASRLFV